MKTRRSSSLSSESRQTKRMKFDTSFFEQTLPPELWLEIIKNLDKKSFRELMSSCKALHDYSSDYRLFKGASWPEVNYQIHLKTIHSILNYHNFNKPRIISLENGDVVIGQMDGKIGILKLGENQWREYGGKFNPSFQVHDVILLDNGALASCAIDGIRVWDRELNQQKYWVSLPKFNQSEWFRANLTDDIRAQYLFELPNKNLVCVCWDGNIHFLALRDTIFGPQYQFEESLRISADIKFAHVCHVSIVKNEIIIECDSFIARVDWKEREFIENITYADNKIVLADAICSYLLREINLKETNPFREYLLADKNDISLEFNWNYPDGYVGISVDSEYELLVNLIDKTKKVLVLGRSGECIPCVTHHNDVVLFDCNTRYLYSCWDKENNEFKRYSKLSTYYVTGEEYFLTADGCLLLYVPGQCDIFSQNAYTSEINVIRLKEGKDLVQINAVLQSHYLLATLKKNASGIWDLRTGDLLFIFPKRKCELTVLPNGDVMKEIEKHHFNDLSDGANMGVHEHEDRIEIHRFGLKK